MSCRRSLNLQRPRHRPRHSKQPTRRYPLTNTPLPGKLTIDATCSLADAITAANSDTASGGCPAGSGADTITLTANITLSERLPLIASDITIEGSANSVSGGYSRRIFTVRPQGHLTINNLTLRNGREGKGGAIYSYGNLTISNSFFTGNRAEINGAAIFIELGTASITNSTFTNNLADEKPRGIIYNKGALTLIHVTMSKNTSKFTNGVWNDNGTLTLRNSIIDDGSHCTGGSVTVTNTYIRDDAWGKACPRTYGPADGALKLGSRSPARQPTSRCSPAAWPLMRLTPTIARPPTRLATTRPVGEACDIGAIRTRGRTTNSERGSTKPESSTATATETTSPTETSDGYGHAGRDTN